MFAFSHYSLEVVDFNEKVKVIQDGLVKHGRTTSWLAEKVNMDPSTLSRRLSGKSKRPSTNKPWVDEALALIRDLDEKLSTPAKTQTDVYYNKDREDSARSDLLDRLLTGETITVDAPSVEVGVPWSAKGLSTVKRTLSALLGAASRIVHVKNSFQNIRGGSVIAFTEVDYPSEDVYLLFVSRTDPETELIGWIDPNFGSLIQGADGKTLPLSEWQVKGYCIAVSWGLGDSFDDLRVSKKGIGPRTRL